MANPEADNYILPRLTAGELERIAMAARRDYEIWKLKNPGKDPVREPYTDMLWNLERAASVLVSLKKNGSYDE